MNIDELKFLKIKTEKHPSTNIQLEYLEHHSAVAVLILDYKEENTLLVEQYRPGRRGRVYEIPAGLIDEAENPLEAMYREVKEETGYSKEDFKELYLSHKPLFISPGYTTERLYFYIIKLKKDGIEAGEQEFDIGEDLMTHWVKVEEAYKLSEDLKTHFALNLYKLNI